MQYYQAFISAGLSKFMWICRDSDVPEAQIFSRTKSSIGAIGIRT